MLTPSLLVLSLLTGVCVAAPAVSDTCLPTVTLDCGVLVGTTTSLASATATVNKFLGVPFAATPPERFSPPTNPETWSGQRNATVLPPSCIQQFNYPALSRAFTIALFDNPGPASESEDCLYLNIFTPSIAPVKNNGGRAVLFWLYGGGLSFGYSGLPIYDGSSFAAEQDVVVVTTNYRTNVFGFSSSPEIAAGEQNSGFLDQRKALEWVQANIAQFGGNPDKVTIFGESAGGYSVKQLLAHPPNPMPYRAAIMESEATFAGNGTAAWATLVDNLNCSSAASPLACVRAVNTSTIVYAIEHLELNFPPVSDGVTNSINVAPLITDGSFAQVPFVIGTNANEGRVFEVGTTNVTAYLEATFPGLTTLQQAIVASYANTNLTGYEIVSDILTNVGFQCPAMTLSQLATSQPGGKYTDTWRYFYNATFPNTNAYVNLGVWHSSEIPIVFGTYNADTATDTEVALSKHMQTAWANFAKYPHQGPGWARVGANSSAAMLGDIGADGRKNIVNLKSSEIDGRCALFAAVIAYLGI